MEQAQGLQRLATQAVLLQSVLPLCMLRTRLPSGPLARCCIHSSKTRLFCVLLSYSPSTAQQLLLAVHSRVDKSTRLVRGVESQGLNKRPTKDRPQTSLGALGLVVVSVQVG
ncbi:hypothetical protein FOC1_g10009988 [Fusarium oxysporum f. sp. cubense race 1]|uniref:Uncharacterized protein n=1 Tax=Fusarium oxysporum f. sp. cubense (strain race 1) TaxID=1229664 RepID=N4UFM9_FUSC1|nr:hypothetical protein FOC1_g10009988 [Fusarium oxysporum f. sp. cubense race 1]